METHSKGRSYWLTPGTREAIEKMAAETEQVQSTCTKTDRFGSDWAGAAGLGRLTPGREVGVGGVVESASLRTKVERSYGPIRLAARYLRSAKGRNVPVPIALIGILFTATVAVAFAARAHAEAQSARAETEAQRRLTEEVRSNNLRLQVQIEGERRAAAEAAVVSEREAAVAAERLLEREHELRVQANELHDAERKHRQHIQDAWAKFHNAMRASLATAEEFLAESRTGEAARAFAMLDRSFHLPMVDPAVVAEFESSRRSTARVVFAKLYSSADPATVEYAVSLIEQSAQESDDHVDMRGNAGGVEEETGGSGGRGRGQADTDP